MLKGISIFCADVGSIAQGNFGWAHRDVPAGTTHRHRGGQEIEQLAAAVAGDLAAGQRVALGFELPPDRSSARRLLQAREAATCGRRASWSAGAGSGVLATGLVQAAWVLRRIRQSLADSVDVHFNWETFTNAQAGLYLWEAFVTSKAKGDSHIDDAVVAINTFVDEMTLTRDRFHHEQGLSLIGAAAIWAGLVHNANMLRSASYVPRPR